MGALTPGINRYCEKMNDKTLPQDTASTPKKKKKKRPTSHGAIERRRREVQARIRRIMDSNLAPRQIGAGQQEATLSMAEQNALLAEIRTRISPHGELIPQTMTEQQARNARKKARKMARLGLQAPQRMTHNAGPAASVSTVDKNRATRAAPVPQTPPASAEKKRHVAELGALIIQHIPAGQRHAFTLWCFQRRHDAFTPRELIDTFLTEVTSGSASTAPLPEVAPTPESLEPLSLPVRLPMKRQGAAVQILSRPDQAAFSSSVRLNCCGVCVVTGTKLTQRCQAAHLVEHRHGGVDHYTNGLWMRTDIHALFDAGLCAIDPQTLFLYFSARALAADPDLQLYHGKAIAPTRRAIDRNFLRQRWQEFEHGRSAAR